MIPRYSRPEMTEIWSDEYKFARWLDVEIALVEAWAAEGVVPHEDAAQLHLARRDGFEIGAARSVASA